MAAWHRRVACLPMIALLCAAGAPARGEDSTTRMFGRTITVSDGDEGQVLIIDGEQILTEIYISIDKDIVVDGIPALVGTASPGGNACEGAPFVISLEKGEAPILSGPIETCVAMEMSEESDQLIFASQAIPGRDGERWAWSPAGGFEEQSSVAFAPDIGKGWAELGRDSLSHPSGLMNYAEIAVDIDALLGDDKDLFETLITGPGSGEYKGSLYVGTACMAHNCEAAQALILADTRQRQIYLAWKAEDEKIVVRPPVGEWPALARVELRAWAVQWK